MSSNAKDGNGKFGSHESAVDTIEMLDGRISLMVGKRVTAQLQTSNLLSDSEGVPYTKPVTEDDIGMSLNIVMQVVGSRGDVQPFIALAQTLERCFGHRVRLATHPVFKAYVEENGIEFFSIGGDPAELMSYMVQNPGLMPGVTSIRKGDVARRRTEIYQIMQGCWRSCTEDVYRTNSEYGNMEEGEVRRPFVADVIIANPPSFAHIHCAEKLGIPLQFVFTMPWSPTISYAHPLANVKSPNPDRRALNLLSYALIDTMTWQGLGDIINCFRVSDLNLEPISKLWAPGMSISKLRIPFTYCWSPSLAAKPADWGSHISVSGYCFLPSRDSYVPPTDIVEFLKAGDRPIYIGFGSIIIKDPDQMTRTILEAIKTSKVRALISKGWGGLGLSDIDVPNNVLFIENVPHDWLFQHVSCVVHHGGAGTTAAGIVLGKPTIIIPFFGDQTFWGSIIARAGAGPPPIPYKLLTAAGLSEAICQALSLEMLRKARHLGQLISVEDGCIATAKSFQEKLPPEFLRCSLLPRRKAVWQLKGTDLKLSALAAAVLVDRNLLNSTDLKINRSVEYDLESSPWDPLSAFAHALIGSFGKVVGTMVEVPVGVYKVLTMKGVQPMNVRDSVVFATETDSPESFICMPISSSMIAESVAEGSKSPVSIMDLSTSLQTSSQSSSTADCSRQVSQEMGTTIGNGSQDLKIAGHADSRFLRRLLSERRIDFSQPSNGARTDHGKIHKRFPAREAYLHILQGVRDVVVVVVRSPLDASYNVARGFHNAPRLYGDTSVRRAVPVTGMQSGLTAAGKELVLGVLDGVTGIVTQPWDGAESNGPVGFVTGIGKGALGFFLKPGAALFGIAGYPLRGMCKELEKHFGVSVQTNIRAVRMAEGFEDLHASIDDERLEVTTKWAQMQNLKQKSASERLNHIWQSAKEIWRPTNGML